MSAEVCFVLDQTERRRKVFLEWTSIDLSTKHRFICDNGNYYKIVYHLIPARGNREHPGNFQNKSVSSPFN